MSTSALDTLYCRFIDSVINHRRLSHLEQFMATNVVEHAVEERVGIDAARNALVSWLAGFPDLHMVIEDVVVDGDRVMARLTATGTHAGPLYELQPTGRHVKLSLFEAWATSDGRCVERWLHVDRQELRRQLGVGASASLERGI